MTFTESQVNLISQALVMASSQYVRFAADCKQMENGERLAEQFMRQAHDARFAAIVFGDSPAISVDCGWEDNFRAEATKIADQELADELESRKVAAS